MKFVKFFAAFVVLVLFTMFATANTHTVPLYAFLKGQSLIGYVQQETTTNPIPSQLPVFLIVFLSFGLGFIVAWILNVSVNRSHKKNIKKLKKENREQNIELEKLRKLPATEGISSDHPSLPMSKEDSK